LEKHFINITTVIRVILIKQLHPQNPEWNTDGPSVMVEH